MVLYQKLKQFEALIYLNCTKKYVKDLNCNECLCLIKQIQQIKIFSSFVLPENRFGDFIVYLDR